MIFAKNFARKYEKEITLGTSDAWSMSCCPRDPAYYIEDCRIFKVNCACSALILSLGVGPNWIHATFPIFVFT